MGAFCRTNGIAAMSAFSLHPLSHRYFLSHPRQKQRGRQCIPDETAPVIRITAPPIGTGCAQTTQQSVDLEGDVYDESGVKMMIWENGVQSGMPIADIDDWGSPCAVESPGHSTRRRSAELDYDLRLGRCGKCRYGGFLH